MIKMIALISAILSFNLYSETYILPLDKKHYKDYIKVEKKENTEQPEEISIAADVEYVGGGSIPETFSIANNGTPLGAGDNPSATGWTSYQNLPDYLIGARSTIYVNNGGSVQLKLNERTEVYILRKDSWLTVPTVGFSLIDRSNFLSYTPSSDISIYVSVYEAGTYNFNTSSAYYLFKKAN